MVREDSELHGFILFAKVQAARLELRWAVIRYALQCVAFWTAALIAGAWLSHWGLSAVAWMLLVVWLYFCIPALLWQSQFILDVVNYALTGKTEYFPLTLALIESGCTKEQRGEMKPSASAFVKWTMPIFALAAATTPIATAAIWSLIVLLRVPAGPHEPTTAPDAERRASIRAAIQLSKKVESAAVEAFAQRQFQPI